MKQARISEFTRSYLAFAVLFVVLLLILPRTAKFNYEYKKGSAWKYETLIAQFNFPILKTEEQIQEEKSRTTSSVIPYYRYSEDVVNKNIKAAEGLSMGHHSALRPHLVSVLRDIYSQGIVSDEGVKLDKNAGDIATEVLYIQKDKRAVKCPATEVYKLTDAKAKLLAEMSRTYKSYNLDSIFRANSVYDLIVPNLVYDKQTTNLVHSESTPVVSPTQGYANAGQLIVSEGEIVTAEIEQMLDSYKEEYEATMGYSGPKVLFWTGNFFIALTLVLILFFVLFFTGRRILMDTSSLLYVLFLFLLSTIGALAVGKSNPDFLYMVPFTLTALWLQAFLKTRVTVPVYIISLFPLLIFTHNGVVLFVMFTLAGLASFYAFRFFNRGWQQFIVAGIAFLTLLLSYTGFRFIDAVGGNYSRTVLFLFIGSVLTVICYQMVYLFERLFNLVSQNRLIELSDTGNALLRELELKAPGTYQHSVQVMGMADAAARSINADVVLVRAGALYHDIGKMNNPLCFIENETLVPEGERTGYHKDLSAKQSASSIIRHVPDGLEIAEKNHLPEIVKEFILTHHGTSCTSYFYNKYLNEGGDPEDTAAFFYSGRKPRTKEQAIVMLCDSIEAASRTLKSNSQETFSSFVDKFVAAKMSDGQFDEADISLKELNTVKDTIKTYLTQIYHERVVYPKLKAKASN